MNLLEIKLLKAIRNEVADGIIHCLSLNTVVAIISGDEELEVRFGILNAADFVLLVDEVPQALEIVREDRVFGKTRGEAAEHIDVRKWRLEGELNLLWLKLESL